MDWLCRRTLDANDQVGSDFWCGRVFAGRLDAGS
jgi:hypothetical protein